MLAKRIADDARYQAVVVALTFISFAWAAVVITAALVTLSDTLADRYPSVIVGLRSFLYDAFPVSAGLLFATIAGVAILLVCNIMTNRKYGITRP